MWRKIQFPCNWVTNSGEVKLMVKFKTLEGDKSERRKLKKLNSLRVCGKRLKTRQKIYGLLLLLHERKSFYEVFHFINAEFLGPKL